MTPKDVGLIMRSMKTDYKFVSSHLLFTFPLPFNPHDPPALS